MKAIAFVRIEACNNIMDLTYEHLSEKTLADVTRAQANDFVRAVALQAKFAGDPNAFHLAMRDFPYRYSRSLNLGLFEKAATAAGSTLDATWAGPLSPVRPLADAFVAPSGRARYSGASLGYATSRRTSPRRRRPPAARTDGSVKVRRHR